MEKLAICIFGMWLGAMILVIALHIFPDNKFYNQGVSNTYKEAFKQGLMVREIDKNDKVVYRWIENTK